MATTDFEAMQWFQAVAMYGDHGNITDTGDEDLKLLPCLIEKVLIPKLTG